MRKWQLSPKFNAYLRMNYDLTKEELGYLVIYAIIYGLMGTLDLRRGSGNTLLIYFFFPVLFVLIRCMPKICKDSLYGGEAVLFRSVPVSEFETVLAKILTGTVCFVIPMLISGVLLITALAYYENLWIAFYQMLINQGFTEGSMAAGAFLSVWAAGGFTFILSEICLLAFALGYRVGGENHPVKRWFAAAATAAVLLAASFGLIIIFWLSVNLHPLAKLFGVMAVSAAEGALLLRLNLKALEAWYCV